MIAWLCWGALALASESYSEQAERMMNVDFADVEATIDRSRKRRAAPPRPAAPAAEAPATVLVPTGVATAALPLEANSTLRTVTVHRDRALVTRTRELRLEAGDHVVTFEGLPLGVTDQGLSAAVVAGEARIVAVELLSGSGEVEATERIDATQTSAEDLLAQLGDVRDQIEALLSQRDYLRSALSPDQSTVGQSVAEVRRGLEFVATSERRIARDLREQQERAEELAEELGPQLVKLDDPLATGQPVRVEVEVDRVGDVQIDLQYAVRGASWSPSYSARLDPSSQQVELQVYGVVRQSSGEDWADAEISLSTAEPAGAASVPVLAQWILGRTSGLGAFTVPSATEGDVDGGSGVVDAQLDADLQSQGATVLRIAGRRNIRGDGSAQRLPVGVQTLAGTPSLRTVPKLAAEVQRRVSVRYDGQLPLLAGPVSSFVGPDYVGSGQIQGALPGQALQLAFGTEDRLQVRRELVRRGREKAGRKLTRFTFGFRTTVHNYGAGDARVTVLDQLPMSGDARVDVKVLELSGGTRGAEDGSVSWEIEVPNDGKTSVELVFEVTVPDDMPHASAVFGGLFR